MIAIVHFIYSQSVHAPALNAGLMDNDAERYWLTDYSKWRITQCCAEDRLLCCIVLCCIMRPYTDGPIGPLSYRHSSGVARNPHSALAEWGIFNLRSISPQGTHLLIARRRISITSVLASISWMTCEPRTTNLSITGERITFTMYSQTASNQWPFGLSLESALSISIWQITMVIIFSGYDVFFWLVLLTLALLLN